MGSPSSASSGSGTVEVLPVSNLYLTQLFLFIYLYNLEIHFSLVVTLAIPLGMLPGRGRLQFPTPEAATRAPVVTSSWLGPGQSCSRVQAWPADDAENRARVWENSVSELSQVQEMRSSLLAGHIPSCQRKERDK